MNELEKKIRRYKLDKLLLLLARQSREMLRNNIYMKNIEWKRSLSRGLSQKVQQALPAWGLADMSYLEIKHSND